MALQLKNYVPAIMAGANIDVSVDLTDITDNSGNEVIEIDGVASAVNFLRMTNAATGSAAALSAQGDDTNVGLNLSSKGTGSVTLWSGDSARELVIFPDVASAVNELTISSAAASSGPIIATTGSDTNIPLFLNPKGTGDVRINNGTDPVDLRFMGAAGGDNNKITDVNGNEIMTLRGVASAVNQINITNEAAGQPPKITVTGDDTNISLRLNAKGTGVIQTLVPLLEEMTQTAITDTATITIAQLLTKVLDGTPTAAATYTLPTAALLVGGIANAQVGDSFFFVINNKSGGANTITVAGGTGGTTDGLLTVAQDVIRVFLIIVTNVTGASEAYFVYGVT